jgi:hypothetical protein
MRSLKIILAIIQEAEAMLVNGRCSLDAAIIRQAESDTQR